ncbi:MAG: alpha/beta hydrolase family protein [Longimicrobiales bacterium]
MLRSFLALGGCGWRIGGVLVLAGCTPALRLAPDDSPEVLSRHVIDASDPSLAGDMGVRRLYYGSGTDRNRPEYRDSVTIRTDSVDASTFVDFGDDSDERRKYWGFTTKGMPLNGRVWYPDGAGPFPLVLIVHGNHNPRDFSDPGYAYLGEHLSSHGYIVASLDMNFINGTGRENDARGWFFLKHLEAWRTFNQTAGGPFAGKVDLERVALIGHSRGGEAVGHAAAFNRLSRYPDDAKVTFDFHFGIRSIIAIAPVDGQYRPAERLVPVEDVNYLVFHGAHDGDVSAFMGVRQYQRVTFTDTLPRFKAAVYVYRANHGQWNSVWGRNDNGRRSSRILDLRTLMPAEDQRKFGKVYITAFLESTLNGRDEYLALFRDHRVAGGWLPKTMYITRFQESSFRAVAGFEEDVDPSTGSASGVVLEGDSLATWRESRLQLRTSNSPQEGTSHYNNAVWIGWNNRIEGDDTTRTGPPAVFTVTLPAGHARDAELSARSSLQFLLMPTDDVPGPRSAPADSLAADSLNQNEPESEEAESDDDEAPEAESDEEKPPIDLSIEIVDEAGATARLPLSQYGAIRRPLDTWILRRRDRERERFGAHSETVLQTYSIPLEDFLRSTPSLDPTRLKHVRFVFDRATAGTVIIDDVGFANMPPAFRRAVLTQDP